MATCHLRLRARTSLRQGYGLASMRELDFYSPFSLTGADIPPRICHVPLVLIQVCVIRIASVRTTWPVSLLAQFALIR